MAKTTLLVAQLEGAQVAGGSQSRATGTAAFLIDPTEHRLTYTATYQGLATDRAGSIGLYNFGPGRNGKLIHMICGTGAERCPGGRSATINGRLELAAGQPFDRLLGEFDNGRVYVEVAGANGAPEIRGQLAPNTAMVPTASYIAQLKPAAGADTKGSGTAVVSQVFLPGGKMAVFYALTVANTSGPPTGVALAGAPSGPANQIALPPPAGKAPPPAGAGAPTGGTLTNQFQLAKPPRDTQAELAARLGSLATTTADLVVATRRAPRGELSGTLTPIR